jgi:hypothetical protein
MRRRTAGPAVSLFPFLAVLLCAMGALILLLIILTRQIREHVLRAADAAPVPAAIPPEPVGIPRVVVTVTPPAPLLPADPNISLRDHFAAAITERDAALAHAEQLHAEVTTRRGAVRAAEETLSAASFDCDATRQRLAAREAELARHSEERTKLLTEVTRAEQAVAATQRAAAAAEPKVSILPYDGPHGTVRRPILIECTRDAIRFLSEEVALSAADLEGFSPRSNPLLAGVAALHEHWQAVDGSHAAKPYVLLLVRPDGIPAYYAARNLLQRIDNHMGYELITERLELAVPKLDPNARDVCRAAVLDLLNKRSSMLVDAALRTRREFPTGRFEVDPGDHDPTRPPDRPFAARGSAGGLHPPEHALVGSMPPLRAAAGDSALESQDKALPIPPTLQVDRPLTGSASHASGSRQPDLPDHAGSRDWPEGLAAAEEVSAKQRWGLSSPTASIALERPVPAEVTVAAVTVGGQPPITVGPQGVTGETLREVLAAVKNEAAAWGRAPGQFYWSPVLQATVLPGGTAHFDRLESALRRSGLRASERIVLEPAAPPFLELSDAAPTL